jgi:Fic family protein
MPYIHELPVWPEFRWDHKVLAEPLAAARHRQGRLIGRMEGLGFDLRSEATLQTMTEEVMKSSEIEGVILDRDQVRSSIARRLGMDIGGLVPADRDVEGVVEMMLDATQNYTQELTDERLFGWHAALFPTGRSGMHRITIGAWRDDKSGPMQVISGPVGRERVHYEAPKAARVADDMKVFLDWFNSEKGIDPVLKAGVAHLWFVTIHPFDDGNGRIARAIADMQLARSEQNTQRFYSMSAQIRHERKAYYEVLEITQKGEESILASVLKKARFWEKHAADSLNDRQRDMLNRLLDRFEGKLTSSKWAKIEKCSPDTALRDITDLLERGILVKDQGGGRSTSHSLATVS